MYILLNKKLMLITLNFKLKSKCFARLIFNRLIWVHTHQNAIEIYNFGQKNLINKYLMLINAL